MRRVRHDEIGPVDRPGGAHGAVSGQGGGAGRARSAPVVLLGGEPDGLEDAADALGLTGQEGRELVRGLVVVGPAARREGLLPFGRGDHLLEGGREGGLVLVRDVGAGEDASVLIPSSGGVLGLEPDTYYGNGTSEQITYGTGSVVRTPSGEYPYSISINGAPNATAGHQVSVDIGDGTFGVGVFGVSYTGPGQPDSQPFLGYRPLGSYGGEDQFYACNGQFYEYTVPLLYWRNETSVTPEDCAEIKLLPQCAGDVVNATQYTQKVSCYDDAASVPVLN